MPQQQEQVFFKCSFCKALLPGEPPHKVEYWNRISSAEWEWDTYWLACKECLPKLEGVFSKEAKTQ